MQCAEKLVTVTTWPLWSPQYSESGAKQYNEGGNDRLMRLVNYSWPTPSPPWPSFSRHHLVLCLRSPWECLCWQSQSSSYSIARLHCTTLCFSQSGGSLRTTRLNTIKCASLVLACYRIYYNIKYYKSIYLIKDKNSLIYFHQKRNKSNFL